jgi:ADP-ribose pyrophosphatase
MTPTILSTESRFSGKVLAVRVDRIRLEDGRETTVEIVEHVGSVAIVPMAEDGGIWFVRQYRHAAGRELLELPAGTLNPGEAPEAWAGRARRAGNGLRAIG